MKKISLYEDEKSCCGCEACKNSCPKEAIEMQEDEFGFMYPKIDYNKCISCGYCKKVCYYQNEKCQLFKSKKIYMSISKDEVLRTESASGGIFAEIARHVLYDGGVVYGCSMGVADGILFPKHIRVDKLRDLQKLQGSKYVQSFIGDSYKLVWKDLKEGNKVLFSGTPCQVGGLYGYLEGKKYTSEHLYTVDIICHGVPNRKFFRDYLIHLGGKFGGTIDGFYFRDKTKGWGLNARVEYRTNNNKEKSKQIHSKLSPYYTLFLQGVSYRESCYTCKYAGAERIGDLTIGDYWGVKKAHPELFSSGSNEIAEDKGISCVLVNTVQGDKILSECSSNFLLVNSSYDKVAKENAQLVHPSKKNPKREQFLEIYRKRGYDGVDSWYFKGLGIRKYFYEIFNLLPKHIQSAIRKIIK